MANENKKTHARFFPQTQNVPGPEGGRITHMGPTIRDYFAAKAMQAMISSYAMSDEYYKEIPLAAYKMADEMLEERSK